VKPYRPMGKMYYFSDRKGDAAGQELMRRREGVSAVKLDFKIGEHPAFIVYCDELVWNISRLYRMCRQVEKMLDGLPEAAAERYVRQTLIEEIHQTNEMERVRSSRREIRESMEAIESGGRGARFDGMIRKYNQMMAGAFVPLRSCHDMRVLYDALVLEDVLKEDKSSAPDGVYFRNRRSGIQDEYNRNIHEGVFPESVISECMEHALDFLNNEEYDLFIRVAAFHYLFGYIHPFYDGNGRMMRFIAGYMLTMGDVPAPMCLRMSRGIRERRRMYDTLFRETNDRRNCGDMTGFVIWFMNMLLQTGKQVSEQLQEITVRLKGYEKRLNAADWTEDQKKVLYALVQASLCSEYGMSRDELVQVCGMSRTKLISILKEIEPYCIVEKEGKKYLYRADTDRLDEHSPENEPIARY